MIASSSRTSSMLTHFLIHRSDFCCISILNLAAFRPYEAKFTRRKFARRLIELLEVFLLSRRLVIEMQGVINQNVNDHTCSSRILQQHQKRGLTFAVFEFGNMTAIDRCSVDLSSSTWQTDVLAQKENKKGRCKRFSRDGQGVSIGFSGICIVTICHLCGPTFRH